MPGVGAAQRQLTAAQQEELKQVYDVLDQDGSGAITALELSAVLAKFDAAATLEDAQRMVAAVDEDGDGQISLDEFLRMMQGILNLQTSASDLFRLIDTDEDGALSRAEVREALHKYGLHASEEDIDEMLHVAGVASHPDSRGVTLAQLQALLPGCAE